MTSKQRKTVTMINMCDPAHPEGIIGYITPETAEFIDMMRTTDDAGRKDLLRVARAIRDDLFPYSQAEVETWTPTQRRAAVDSLPEYAA